MVRKIFRGALLIAVLAAALMSALASAAGYLMAEEQTASTLRRELETISSLKKQTADNAAYLALLSGMKVGDRLTWIGADGMVLYDNQSQAQTMENHLNRAEVAQAAASGQGMAKRYSATLMEEQVYCALRLQDGSILRAAATQRSIGGYMTKMIWVMLAGTLAVALVTALLSKRWTAKLVSPINAIDLENPLSNTVYDELSPMLRRMEEQKRKLEAQWQELSQRQKELDAILKHMEEGLVFLDRDGHVLMMNQSARQILHTQREISGSLPLSVYNRSQTLLAAVGTAAENGSAHGAIQASGRDYRLTVSTVKGDEGMVLLLQDVTEQNAAERSRQRFSANVSHELRTPLTTISGYAELMQNGMMQPGDVPVFARKIYDESRRLLQLIEDIMHLSQLDEGFVHGRQESVSLLEEARAAMEELTPLAQDRNVTLTVTGDDEYVRGDGTLINEMLRNLMENAVKYNHAGGWVRTKVENEGDAVRVTVADSGIGIPQEHISRVFERFYRVDKSRSKQTGGTGLGLSIVKHGAEYHKAKLTLTSEEGEGTTVTLVFPAEKLNLANM